MPQIWQQNSELVFCIAGRQPPQAIQALAQQHSQIEVIADPEDMSLIARQCSCSVVPLRLGSGTRIKILHSMAMGLPVVATNIGCEGLIANDREHLIIQDQPKSFARAVLKLIQDRQLWHKLQVNGRQLVESEYDWTKIFGEYEQQLIQKSQKAISN